MFHYAHARSGQAVIAGAVAAAATLVFAGMVMFWLLPPIGMGLFGPIPIDLDVFGTVLWRSVVGSLGCLSSGAPFSIDCHLEPFRDLFSLMTSTLEARQAMIYTVMAVVVAGGVAFGDALIHAPLSETAQTKRGRAITFGEQARRAIRRFIASRGGDAGGLWLLPHVRLSRKQEVRNILLLGGHGSGKTGWLRGLIEQLLERPGKTFILDVKGDMVAGLPLDQFILVAAADARSWAWDAAADLRTRMHAAEFASKIVAAAEHDPMWADAARAILADLIVYLQKQPERWGWPELAELILSPPAQIKVALSSIEAPSATLITFNADNEESRTVLSILTTLWVAALTQIVPLADAWREVPADRRFSIREWTRQDGSLPDTLVFQKSAEYPELSSAIGAHIVDAIAAFVLSPDRTPADRGSYAMVLDEFPELGIAAKHLPRLLALGREAGVTTIATLQDLGQLEEIYGETQALLIEARLGIRCVLALEDGETTHRVCETWIGEREVRREREPTSQERKDGMKWAYETVEEPVIAPSAIADDLGTFERGGVLWSRALVLGFATVAQVEIPLTIWPRRREAFEPAPWLTDGRSA